MAVLLTWVLFAGWSAVGLAVLNVGGFRGGLRKLLLAPTVGFGALAVVTYIVTRLGSAVDPVAWPIGAAALTLTAVALWATRVRTARAAAVWRRSRAFLLVLVAAFALTAWPMARAGFDWVAQGNDDMANYCLGAAGFRAHGYTRVPDPGELMAGQDMSQQLWFLYRDAGTLTDRRCGAELTLALVSVWTGLAPQQVFMPATAALHLAMIAATAGLVLLCTRRRAAALWAAALLAVSSQATYGLTNQLIAQAGGLALLCTAVAMVSAPFRRHRARLIGRRAAVCGLVFAALIVFYPEAVPFLVGACVLLGVRDIARRRLDRRHLGHAAAAIAAMAVLVPVYLYGTAFFLLGQADQGTNAKTHTLELFPYFMTPRGPALVWGLLPSHGAVPEPLLSACVVLGVGLLGAGLVMGFGQFRRGRAFAAVLLVMATMAAVLYAQKAAFGLFKIAMFAQPFLWATAAAWVTTRRRRWGAAAAAAGLLVVFGLNARTQYGYVSQSTGRGHQVDLAAVSEQHLMTQARHELAARRAGGTADRVVLVTENNVLFKLLAAEVLEVPNARVNMAPFHRYLAPEEARGRRGPSKDTPATRAQDAMWLGDGLPWVRDPDTGRPLFQLLSAPDDWTADRPDRVLVLGGRGPLSVLNRCAYPEPGPGLLCAPLSEVRNLAVFRDATGARQPFLGMDDAREVALNRLEPDPFFRDRTMAGVGRHLVLDVLNPSPRVRVLVDYTTAFRADPARLGLPRAEVVGDRRVPLGAVGVGAARLVSPPLAPQALGPSRLLAIDFATELTRHPNHLRGAEKWWGTDLPRDRRLLAATARNISVISDEEYAAFRPPAALTKFPDDLLHPHLEYSGLYEHGWVGRVAKLRLTQGDGAQELVLRCRVPHLEPVGAEFRTELTVLVDGRPAETRALAPGDFEVRAPGGPGPGPRWVEFRFSHDQELPAPDERRVAALVLSVGFEPRDERRSRPPERLSAFPTDLMHPKLEQAGIFADGWTAPAFKARLHAEPGREAVVCGTVHAFTPGFRTTLTVLVDGAVVAEREVGAGDFEVRAPAAPGPAGPRWVEVRASRSQVLPAPDGRTAGVLLRSLGFEPAK